MIWLLSLVLLGSGCLQIGRMEPPDLNLGQGNVLVVVQVPHQYRTTEVSALGFIQLQELALKVTRKEHGEEPFSVQQVRSVGEDGTVTFSVRLPEGSYFLEIAGLQDQHVVMRDSRSASYWLRRRDQSDWDFHSFPHFVESSHLFTNEHHTLEVIKDRITRMEGDTGVFLVLEPGYLQIVFAEELDPSGARLQIMQRGNPPVNGIAEGNALFFSHVPVGGWVLEGEIWSKDATRYISYPFTLYGGRLLTIALTAEALPGIQDTN